MRCLYVRHPFAGWIVDGIKDIEYRTRATKVRGRVGIIQSRTGTVIGDVEITGCTYNEELDLYEWELACPVRYAKPVPFAAKHGAVIFLDVDYNPDAQEVAPKLSGEAIRREAAAYEAALQKFLHPAIIWTVCMKDGRRIQFESDEELDKFEAEHIAEIDHIESEEKE